jgi:hypothetical protein
MPLLKKPVILAAAFGSIVLGALPVHSAERFRPPSEVLREPANVLAVAMAAEIVGPARIRFEVVELLSDERAEKLAEVSRDQQTTQVGPSPDAENADQSWNVGMSPRAAAEVMLGGTYIIGTSRYLRGRFPLPKWRLDPEGYRLVELPVVGEAIFGFSAHLEFLLTTTPEVYEESPREVLGHISPLLWGESNAARRCAVLEFYFHPRLGGKLQKEEIVRLRSTIEDEAEDPVIRDYLLQIAAMFPARGEPDWVANSCRTVLRRAPLKVQLGSAVASFQHTTLRTLKGRGNSGDLDLAARLLRSASPGVTLSALQTMETLDPKGAIEEARAALSVAGLPEQSRRYIESFLKRAENNSGQNKKD